jgi:formyltetrahydrofolate-dependent phosphoribosylglycinamide formyltransferase
MKKIVVLVSGEGTNLQSIIDHFEYSKVAKIARVISNVSHCRSVERAKLAKIPVTILCSAKIDKRDFQGLLYLAMERDHPDLIVLAGFMKILSEEILERIKIPIINTHPSLLPKFKGAHAIKDVLQSDEIETGFTIHYVTKEVDSGKIIYQERVPVYPNDTEDTLTNRIKPLENKALPKIIESLLVDKDIE